MIKKLLLLIFFIGFLQVNSQINFRKITPPQTMAVTALYDSIYYWTMDTNIMVWNVYDKEVNFIYDANQNNTSYINQGWNDTVWFNQDRVTDTFDINNNKIYQMGQTWNGGVWKNNSRMTFSYDANNNDTSILREAWSGGIWVKTMQQIYTYDVNNNKTSFLYQYWSGSNLLNQFKSIYTYNSNNKMVNQLSQSWNGTIWVNYEQHIYTYNTNNYIVNDSSLYWTAGSWLTKYQTIYTYDANNNNVKQLSQTWNGTTWVNSSQISYTYDANNLILSQVYGGFNNVGILMQNDSTHYYYSSITGIKSLTINNNQVTVYPNPSSTFLNINLIKQKESSNTVKLTNIIGQTVLYKNIGKNVGLNEVINIADFAKGVYTLMITDDSNIVYRKIILE